MAKTIITNKKKKKAVKRKLKAIEGRPRIGDLVRDIISGVEGIVVARTLYLNGCVQLTIGVKSKAGALIQEEDPSIDEQSLELLKRNPNNFKIPQSELEIDDDDEAEVGGPRRMMKRGNY